MKSDLFIELSEYQIDKLGNSLIYLSQRIDSLSKTKALKLIYILDELSIKESGIPFFNLQYKVWKFGPVSEELFIDLSTDTSILKSYIVRKIDHEASVLKPISEFNDDEFTDNDIALMDFVISKFGSLTAKDLVQYTHRKNAPWYLTAEQNNVLELLLSEKINNTEIKIDMGQLVAHDERKTQIYHDYILAH